MQGNALEKPANLAVVLVIRRPQHTWTEIVAEFVGQVRQGKITNGFLQAIDKAGSILQEHFPIEPVDKNELPNHLVEI